MKSLLLVFLTGFMSLPNAYGQAANPDDLRQARQFVSQLPDNCKDSQISTASDGTVVINFTCIGNSKAPGLSGAIEIKNGIVRKIR